MDDGEHALRQRLSPMYRPTLPDGTMVLYAGDLVVAIGDEERPLHGQIELRQTPRTRVVAHFAGPFADLHGLAAFDQWTRKVALPHDASLQPPGGTTLPEPDGGSWIDEAIPLEDLPAGDASSAESFLFHVSGFFEAYLASRETAGGGYQPQLDFSLPGWNLTLAPVSDRAGEEDFAMVVQARPAAAPVAADDVDQLADRIFLMLSFIASCEVGISPVCGLDHRGRVTWATFRPARRRLEKPGVRWCPAQLVRTALPAIAQGFSQVVEDPATDAVLGRAINHLLAANGGEVLDVRVPVACAGLELLSWGVLQRQAETSRKVLRDLSAGAAVRLLLQWAKVPVLIPEGLDALTARRERIGSDDWAGPETLFSVRNKLVHPPNRIDNPEWPSLDELFEAWQLATWYLELVILRTLDYSDDYWSRLRLGRMASDVEPVPWAGNG